MMKNRMDLPQKLKIELHIQCNYYISVFTNKPKAAISKDICTPMFIAALFTIGKILTTETYLER